MNLKDITLNQVRVVTMHFEDGTSREHMVLATEVDRFVEATKRLHFSPGINPHTGGQTKKVLHVTIAPLGITGPYWWTTPNLVGNYLPSGARLIQADAQTRMISFGKEDAGHLDNYTV